MTISSVAGRAGARPATIETRASWIIALTALGIYSLSFGAPIVTVVALKQIAAELGGGRSLPALAGVAVPVALLMFGPAPEIAVEGPMSGPTSGVAVLGWRPRTVQILLCAAGFLCCVPMAMPQSHLVAFCSDVGIPAVSGAAMLSLLLACGLVSRQLWGAVADRIGGIRTILAGSVCQVTAMLGRLVTQNGAGLLFASAA